MDKHSNKKKPYETEAEELGDPRPQPQVSGADFSEEETVPQNPPPEKPVKKEKEQTDKE
ncbi:hypothetical protein [Sediminibacterium soli]|uniref:hypothetical protein n=1 Tax=Sediminibacterium soli TaxID=2698829 RepID=UPI00137B69A5|nr:hypothetical protein [Sediminibacterium soli]NCI46810.1 hypothetical protein [Sediminibacterium soli]